MIAADLGTLAPGVLPGGEAGLDGLAGAFLSAPPPGEFAGLLAAALPPAAEAPVVPVTPPLQPPRVVPLLPAPVLDNALPPAPRATDAAFEQQELADAVPVDLGVPAVFPASVPLLSLVAPPLPASADAGRDAAAGTSGPMAVPARVASVPPPAMPAALGLPLPAPLPALEPGGQAAPPPAAGPGPAVRPPPALLPAPQPERLAPARPALIRLGEMLPGGLVLPTVMLADAGAEAAAASLVAAAPAAPQPVLPAAMPMAMPAPVAQPAAPPVAIPVPPPTAIEPAAVRPSAPVAALLATRRRDTATAGSDPQAAAAPAAAPVSSALAALAEPAPPVPAARSLPPAPSPPADAPVDIALAGPVEALNVMLTVPAAQVAPLAGDAPRLAAALAEAGVTLASLDVAGDGRAGDGRPQQERRSEPALQPVRLDQRGRPAMAPAAVRPATDRYA